MNLRDRAPSIDELDAMPYIFACPTFGMCYYNHLKQHGIVNRENMEAQWTGGFAHYLRDDKYTYRCCTGCKRPFAPEDALALNNRLGKTNDFDLEAFLAE